MPLLENPVVHWGFLNEMLSLHFCLLMPEGTMVQKASLVS